MVEKESTIYCDWCGEFPYHISVYEDKNSNKETFLCENCFNQFLAEQE